MKTFSMCLLISLITLLDNKASAQVLESEDIVIDAYYGFPNIMASLFRTFYADDGNENDLVVTGLGPFGVRGEYLIDENIGFGIDIAYNSANLKFTREKAAYDEMGYEVIKTYEYNLSTTKIGIMATFNYHFIYHESLDFYGVVGLGFKNRSYALNSTEPKYDQNYSFNTYNVFPVSARVGLGIRYIIVDNIGFNVAVGLGQGGLFNAGVTLKI